MQVHEIDYLPHYKIKTGNISMYDRNTRNTIYRHLKTYPEAWHLDVTIEIKEIWHRQNVIERKNGGLDHN
jgi:hypothetical protein